MLSKYFFVFENDRQFLQHKFGRNDRMDKSSKVYWYPLSSQTRLDYVRMITRSDVDLSDGFAGLGDFFREHETGFVA